MSERQTPEEVAVGQNVQIMRSSSMSETHTPEDGATLTERIKAVIEREVYCVVVIRPEHDSACPGGGDYCSHHCPVPVQDYGDIAALAQAIAEDLEPRTGDEQRGDQ